MNEPGADTEPGVIIDPGHRFQLGPISQIDAALNRATRATLVGGPF
jgi:hypothetical protein